MSPASGSRGRRRIAFVTAALLPDREMISSFDFFAVLTSEVLRNLQDLYDVIVQVPTSQTVDDAVGSQLKIIRELLERGGQYSGIIITPVEATETASAVVEFLPRLKSTKLVTIDQSLEESKDLFSKAGLSVPLSVVADNKGGGAQAAKALWHYYESFPSNHKPNPPKFLVIEGTGASPERLKGFREWISKKGSAEVEPSGGLQFTRASGYDWFHHRLHTQDDWNEVVGVFACNDELALGICEALDDWLTASPVRPAMHFAIVGFDGIRDVTHQIESSRERWLVNTVKNPINRMAESLKRLIEGLLSGEAAADSVRPVKCELFREPRNQLSWKDMAERRSKWSLALSSKPRPEIVAITMKEEEEDAILRRLPQPELYAGSNRTYKMFKLIRQDKSTVRIALIRPRAQGALHALDTTRDAIEDLNPKLIALVGIGGAKTEEDFGLGDVVVCTELHDFTVAKYIEELGDLSSKPTIEDRGGPMDGEVIDLINIIRGSANELAGWEDVGDQPQVLLSDDMFYSNDPEWTRMTMECMRARFGDQARMRTKPKWRPGPIASDSRLVKDSAIMKLFLDNARDVAAVEMELPGVYIGARRRRHTYPILAIRGISDVVGYKRSAAWTNYACETAAAFFAHLFKMHPAFNPAHGFFASLDLP